jgi:hypothetical protein
MSSEVELLELAFVTDHPPIRKQAASGDLTDVTLTGQELLPPHWKRGSQRNHPVSLTKGQRISAVLTLATNGHTEFKIQGKSTGPYLNFPPQQGKKQGSSLEKIQLLVASNKVLPKTVMQLKESVIWTITEKAAKREIARTGPHEVFVLWGKPVTESSRWKMTNLFTYQRLKLLTSDEIAGGTNNVDEIARAIQEYVNAHRSTRSTRKVTYAQGGDGGELWGLLEHQRGGQCGEHSYLMELMNRLLGINAIQKHVRASTTVKGVQDFLDYEGHKVGYETRTCAFHGEEKLAMTFGYRRNDDEGYAYKVNYGEGTCEVNGRLYAGLVDKIGISGGGRTAAHNLLLAIEAKEAPNLRKSKETDHNDYDNDRFQIWVTMDAKGEANEVCEKSRAEQLAEAKKKRMTISERQADPYPPVPRG